MFKSAALVLVMGAAVVGCGEDDGSSADKLPAGKGNLVQVATAAGDFSTLVGALEATGLDEVLAGPGPFTVFAPTDAAFARLPSGVLASLDVTTLSTILTYHVVGASVPAASVVGLPAASTVQGESVGIWIEGGKVLLNGFATVVTTDIVADNGIIHVIDAVLLPPSVDFPGTLVDALAASPLFDPLVSAVVSAGLATTLAGDNGGAGFTVFAPTAGAFAELGDISGLSTQALTNVLLYHVLGQKVPAATVVGLTSATTLQTGAVQIEVSGGAVTLDGSARVVRTDLRAQNGVIHVVDAVLMP